MVKIIAHSQSWTQSLRRLVFPATIQCYGVFIYLLISSFYLHYYSIMVKRPVLLGLYLQIILCFHYLLLIIIQLQFILRANLVYQFYCCHILPSLGYSRKNPHPPPDRRHIFLPPQIHLDLQNRLSPPPPPPLRNPSKNHSACLYNCVSSPKTGLAQ